jgi:hypothetical protein
MSFDNKLSVDHDVARTERVDGEHKITITVERTDGKPIDEGEARRILTRNLPTMFTQTMRF